MAEQAELNGGRNAAAPWRDAIWIALLAPALIAGCVSSGFLEYDDPVHYHHELMRPGVPLSGIFRATENSTYFPITVLSYRFDRWLYEDVLRISPAPGVRVSSLLLHLCAGIFLWRALLLLRLGRWLSLFVAAAWTVHPTACESVCWISERKNVLAAFFGFASLWLYFSTNARAWLRLSGTAVLFILAMLSKPTAAGFLPVYFLAELYFFTQRRKGAEGAGAAAGLSRSAALLGQLVFYAALIGVIVFLAKVNVSKTETSNATRAGGSLFTVALTDVPIIWEYIAHSLWPLNLSIFYHSPIVTSLGGGLFWSRLVLLASVVAFTIWMSSNGWRTVFLWGWFIGALGPALNIIPLPYLMQDRYAYFALPAILVIAAETVALIVRRILPSKVRPELAIASVLACLAAAAFFRSLVYRSDFELFQDAVGKQPNSAYAQMHYALAVSRVADYNDYSGEGNPRTVWALRHEAQAHLVQATRCDDFDRLLDIGRVRILIGVLDERLGNDAAAFPVLREELAKPQKPYNNVIALQSLARINLRAGQPQAALDDVERALKSFDEAHPSAELLYLKGNCLEALNRVAEARAIYMSIPEKSMAFKRAQSRLSVLKDR
ncbi:MAG TPA: tetratricopeptide repeat protein [Planctomycetota bacterium]|nr:tetratricopeptide repeat protein [Planctomycetota bacterium]